MKKQGHVKTPLKILFIEDVGYYSDNLSQLLNTDEQISRPVEIISALCLEEAYSKIKTDKVDGFIIDLEIDHCTKDILSKYEEQRLDLTSYSPSRFFGIGILLFTQHSFEWIQKVPKLVLSDYPFDDYSEYYNRLKGPGAKDHSGKAEDDEENYHIIAEWIKNNF